QAKQEQHTSLESSAISSSTNPPNPDDTTEINGHEPSPGNHVTPSCTQAPQATDEEELDWARLTYGNRISLSYQYYLTPERSNQLDKHKQRMIAYPCILFGQHISRLTSDSSCSNLNKDVAGCLRKHTKTKKTHTLASLGIKGTGEIDPKEVCQAQ
ncbi:hypothetical protein PSTT_12174, partial [Puccinia striiformis]